ncbi:MAG: BrnA antitoxin family protein [Candidatus Riflebacteria bacterium]|nr:BrnA antitoxin family protein [Candidatus Riflebacteria bacterium]
MNTPEEEARIQAGIAFDPDNPELTEDDFRRMHPASEVCPEIVAACRKGRGPNKEPTKEPITLRLSREVLDFFRSTGPGWQTRINDALLELARKKSA